MREAYSSLRLQKAARTLEAWQVRSGERPVHRLGVATRLRREVGIAGGDMLPRSSIRHSSGLHKVRATYRHRCGQMRIPVCGSAPQLYQFGSAGRRWHEEQGPAVARMWR